MAPVSWTEFNCLKTAKPPRGDSTTNSPGVPGAHLIDFRKMKVDSSLDPDSSFEHRTPESSTLTARIGKYQLA